MNTFVQSITYPPIAFLLGVTVAIGIAWCIRKAETRELVNKMMRRREFEFAGRTWIAYAQGMTAREKREWARKLNKQMPPKPGPRLPPWAAGHNPPPPKSGRPEPPPSPPPPRDVDSAPVTGGLPWALEEEFKLQLRASGLTGQAAALWSVALTRSAPNASDLCQARRIVVRQFTRGTLAPDEVRTLTRFCPTLFPWEKVCQLRDGNGGWLGNLPAHELHRFANWAAVCLPPVGKGLLHEPPGAE